MRLGSEANGLLERIERQSGVEIRNCYQCGKCVGSCPVAAHMTAPPRQMMQFIKLGQAKEVLQANSSWYCLTCATCSARCPRELDIPRVMEAVRHLAIRDQVACEKPDVKAIRKLHEIFLRMLETYGRLFELRLMAEFNIRTWNFFKDIALGPQVIGKGKLAFLPSRVENIEAIEKLFEACERLDQQHAKGGTQ